MAIHERLNGKTLRQALLSAGRSIPILKPGLSPFLIAYSSTPGTSFTQLCDFSL